MTLIILFTIYLGLFFLGCPVSFAMAIASSITIMILGIPAQVVVQNMIKGVESFGLLAIPFFILAANIMNEAGITKRIFSFSNAAVGWIKGGLGHVNILASMIFAGISGAATADAAGLGLIEMKAMNEAGYDKEFSAAITASSSMLGPIIPPSIVLVVYGYIADVSIGRLFLAGIFPGILAGFLLMVMVYLLASFKIYKIPEAQRFDLNDFKKKLKYGIAGIVAPIIILTGITTGIVTPTESGILASVYSLIVWFIYEKSIPFKKIIKVLKETVISSSLVLFLISTATPLVWVITKERVVVIMSENMLKLTDSPVVLLILINILLLFAGCVLNQLPALLILVPVLHPIALQMGMDPVHFGLMMVFNLMIGMITPPFGVGLFIVSAIADVPIDRLARAAFPFFIALLIALILIAYIPSISLFLPNLLFGN